MPLIGREGDVEVVSGLCRAARVVSIVGAGGVGKTQLAHEVAARVAAERKAARLWVDLTVTGPGGVAAAWWDALGERPDGGGDVEGLLAAYTSAAPAVVVVDNCEHVLGEVTDLVERLAARAPDLRILTTSRQRLELPGETTYQLAPLAVPAPGATVEEALRAPAVLLFLARARQVAHGYRVADSQAASVAAICRLLEGNPLAVRLAAGRITALAPSALLAALADSPAVLRQSGARGHPRHRSVTDSIAWSYGRLDPDARSVLRRLAVFPGAFDLEAAAPVAMPDVDRGEAAARLAHLVDVSLVEADAEGDTARPYRLHTTVRQFAAAALGADERDDARARHAREVLTWVMDRATWGTRYSETVGTRLPDVRDALAWALAGDPGLACRTLATSALVLSTVVDVTVAIEWLGSTRHRDEHWHRAVAQLGVAAWAGGRRLAPLLPEVMARAAEEDDDHVLRLLRLAPAGAAMAAGDLGPSNALRREAHDAGDSFVTMLAATSSAGPTALGGDRDSFEDLTGSAEWAFAVGGVAATATAVHSGAAFLAHQHGRRDRADDLLARASGRGTVRAGEYFLRALVAQDRLDRSELAAIEPEPGETYFAGVLRPTLSWCRAAVDAGWAAVIDAATQAERAAPDRWMTIDALAARGAAEVWLGQVDAAARTAQQLDALAGRLHDAPRAVAAAARLRGRVELARGEPGAAATLVGALAGIERHGLALLLIDVLDLLAAAHLAAGAVGSARALASAAGAGRIETGAVSRLHVGPPDARLATVGSRPVLSLPEATALARRRPRRHRSRAPVADPLTPTERLVADLAASGQTNREIAANLSIAVSTVKSHLSRAFVKVGATNRTHLAARLRGDAVE